MKLRSNRRSYNKRKWAPNNEDSKNPKVVIVATAAIIICVLILALIGFIAFKGDVTDKSEDHCTFYLDSTKANLGSGETVTMDSPFIKKDDTGYLPLSGIADVFGGTSVYDEETKTVTVTGLEKKVQVTVGSAEMILGNFDKKYNLGTEVISVNDSVYVPARTFFEALDYTVVYTGSSGRLDVFVGKADQNDKPVCSFTTDKKEYEAGEKVIYSTESSSEKGYEIVEEKWEGMQTYYFEAGEYTISYSVKDYRGVWSDPVEQTITVTGEYTGASEVAIMVYQYITEDSADIYTTKTVTEEYTEKVTEPDPDDATKTIEKEETKTREVEKKIKGKYYGDDRVISLDQFTSDMEKLEEIDARTLTIFQYLEYRELGQMPPQDSVIILFEGGYSSTYELAYPILKKYGFNYNIAVDISMIGDDGTESDFPVMSYADINEMANDLNVEIGAMGYDAIYDGESLLAEPLEEDGITETDTEYKNRVYDDTQKAYQALLDNITGKDHNFFYVYPLGEISDVLCEVISDSRFECGITAKDGCLTGDEDVFEMPVKIQYPSMK